MPNYEVYGEDLTAVANAIRTKADISGSLSFPSGFVSAIGDIGGSSVTYPTITVVSDENAQTLETTWTYSCDMTFAEFKAVWNEVKDTWLDWDSNEKNNMPVHICYVTKEDGVLLKETTSWDMCEWTDDIKSGMQPTPPASVTEAFFVAAQAIYYCNDNNFYYFAVD